MPSSTEWTPLSSQARLGKTKAVEALINLAVSHSDRTWLLLHCGHSIALAFSETPDTGPEGGMHGNIIRFVLQ